MIINLLFNYMFYWHKEQLEQNHDFYTMVQFKLRIFMRNKNYYGWGLLDSEMNLILDLFEVFNEDIRTRDVHQ